MNTSDVILVAGFMGYDTILLNSVIDNLPKRERVELISNHVKNNAVGLYYNCRWNWLMPVIEKIESLQFRFTIVKNNYVIEQFQEDTEDYISILYFHGYSKKSKIEMVYQGVVEFIKWYNEQRTV